VPNPLNNVQTSNVYTDACSILGVYGGHGGTFFVSGQPVYYEIQYGRLGEPHFTEEGYLSPGAGSIEPGAIGIRFRSANTGQPATVTARIDPPSQPGLQITAQSPSAGVVVTGIIPAAGNVATAGSGFTYTHVNGSGVYVFTFTTPFSAAPVVVANATIPGGGGAAIDLTFPSVNGSGFTINVHNNGGLTDFAFNFLAQAVV